MKDKPISVSIRANKIYTQSLKALAQSKGIPVADLTRKAIDDCLSNELAPFLSFFTNDVYDSSQSSAIEDRKGTGVA